MRDGRLGGKCSQTHDPAPSGNENSKASLGSARRNSRSDSKPLQVLGSSYVTPPRHKRPRGVSGTGQ